MKKTLNLTVNVNISTQFSKQMNEIIVNDSLIIRLYQKTLDIAQKVDSVVIKL
ncbi:hypothetical protein [Saccharolobus islandicus]|uniref:hypothetical protein n=1 Tax=Saccharolobus islandicus TaxID=43080 RepID=UPI000B226BC7|nr:hypothetical protein [Sulfolobus islandicus]